MYLAAVQIRSLHIPVHTHPSFESESRKARQLCWHAVNLQADQSQAISPHHRSQRAGLSSLYIIQVITSDSLVHSAYLSYTCYSSSIHHRPSPTRGPMSFLRYDEDNWSPAFCGTYLRRVTSLVHLGLLSSSMGSFIT